ncbi:MAG: response regulator transcription factor [Syntrophobacteraceae bacterium]
MNHLLLIDDDIQLCELLKEYLESEGFEITAVNDGREGFQRALHGSRLYDLIILDLVLPGMDGFEVLQKLRSHSATPVIMCSGRNQAMDRVIGLEFGADDFILKPFDIKELIARIRAVLRRTGSLPSTTAGFPKHKQVAVGDVLLDSGTRTVCLNGLCLHVTSAEFNLLQILLEAAGRVVTREYLASQCLGRDLRAYDRSLDVHMSRLRKKLGAEYKGNERIKTVRNVGYIYSLPSDTKAGDRG